ncbi:MAG TPA: PRC-barrel domain-containing protein [Roseiarcus sp.]|nr:PRC-barrel domain-containing protein [Roseiarcus sp.]
MLFAASGLVGRPVAARDSRIGAVKDFLIDDRAWTVRWMVVDTGHWLPGRKILVHPSAVAPIHLPERPAIPMLSMGQTMTIEVNLTVHEVQAGPDAGADEPVTAELERRCFDHYGWDPFWSAPGLGEPLRPAAREVAPEVASEGADPHLGGAAALKNFAVDGADGRIGSIDNVLIDDVRWAVRSFVVATRGWLAGKHVLVPIGVARSVDWGARTVRLSVTRERAKDAPEWDPLALIGED